MLKEGKLYYSISEVTEEFDLTPSLLRYWEKNFSIIKPKTNDRGTRHYTQKDIQNIRMIKYLLKEKRMTIKGAQKQLQKNNANNVNTTSVIDKLNIIKARLHDIKNEMKYLEE